MGAGAEHLEWKAEHLSATHTLWNTERLVEEAVPIMESQADGE